MDKKELVGYRGKSGQLRAWRKIAEAPDKFNAGKTRVRLESLDGELSFWTDKDKLEAPPPASASARRRTGCSCNEGCCQPRCRCGRECNCQGGPIYDC